MTSTCRGHRWTPRWQRRSTSYHDRGELWLVTGNVPAYWAHDQREMPFEQLFPKADTWAASVPLSTHLFFVDGVGTRPR